MYVELDFAAADAAVLTADERVAVENIGQAVFHGMDYLVLHRQVAELLADAPWLSEVSRAAFRRMATSFSSRRVMPRPDLFIVVRRGVLEPEPSGSGWIVPLAQLKDRRFINERSLICEDLDDVDFYVFTAEAYAKVNGFAGAAVALRPVNGGGSNTPDVVARSVARGESFLVIVDSDKRHSADALGDVARGTQREFGQPSWYRSLAVTPGKSVENLVPIAWLRLTQCGAAAIDTLERLDQAEQVGCHELRSYAPLKQSFHLCVEGEDPRFAALVADVERISDAGMRVAARCGARCVAACRVWTGLGTSVPGQVVLAESRIRRDRLLEELATVAGAEALAKRVFEFGLAAPRMRA